MAFDILTAIDTEHIIDFMQNYSVTQPTVLDTIFPDEKTPYLKATYYRLMAGQRLPKVAYVHALDTEARIGTRPSFEKVLTEKTFIKEKINQTESLQQAIENGVPNDNSLIKYVFDDAARLFDGVIARTKVMKGQILTTGKIAIYENNIATTIDMGVPSECKVTMSDWSKADADILSDIQKMVDIADDAGYVVNKAITSRTMINYMKQNTAIQAAALGTNNTRILTSQELANLLMQEYGISIDRCDGKYRYDSADGTMKTGRYFKENVFTLYEAEPDGSFGVGLWGATPEELEYRQFLEEENQAFVTLTQWATPDPVAVWTKASGMFIPVVPKAVGGIVIGTKGN